LDRQGTILESRCSGWAIDARIRELKRKEPTAVLSELTASMTVGEAKQLPIALQKGDAVATRILDELVEDVAFGLSHVVHLFHPSMIVVGGGLSGIGEPLRQGLARTLPTFLMEAFAPGPKIALAALGEDAVPAGALELAKGIAMQDPA
jgi:glucokinase